MPWPIKYISKDGVEKSFDELFKFSERTGGLITLGLAESEVHQGSSFTGSNVQNVNTTTFKWQFEAPDANKIIHIVFGAECTGEMLSIVSESSDRVTGGLLTVINRNRIIPMQTSDVVISTSPTGGTTDGATIFTTRNGASGVSGKTLTGGGGRDDNEFVLRPNIKYILSCTTFADVYVAAHFNWYEVTKK